MSRVLLGITQVSLWAILLVFSSLNMAADCALVFPDTVANSDDDGSITIGFGTQLINSPDNNIETTDLDVGPDNFNCELGPCSATGTSASGGTFSDFPGGISTTIGTFGSASLVPGDYGALILGTGATLTLDPGVYTFSGGIVLGNGAEIIISAEGGTSIFSNAGINIGNNIDINQSGSNRDLFIYSNANISIGRTGSVDALIYSRGNVSVGRDTDVSGAISAEGDIVTEDATFFLPISFLLGFYNHVNITYDNSGIDNIPFAGFCEGGISSGPTLDRFEFSIGGASASVCEPYDIGITAIDDNGDTFSDYNGTIALSTSTNNGDWQSTGTPADAQGNLTPTGSDAGQASYEFEATGADNGVITLALANTHAETLTVTATDSDAGVSSTSAAITFAENAFVVSNADSLGDDVIAGRRHAFVVNMRARDPVTGVCPAVTVDYDVADVDVWISRSASDPGGINPVMNNSDDSDSVTLNNSQVDAETINLNFADGQAEFSLDTSDVGQFALEFLDASLSFSDQPILGSSETLTSRPFGFAITVAGNPRAASASEAVFLTAGSGFTVSVTAKSWHSSDDSNDDGVADFYTDADISNNLDFSGPDLPAFGQESPTETVTLSASLVLPAGGVDPGLEENSPGARVVTGFTGGTGNSGTVYFDEVGIAVLAGGVSDGVYLGATNTAASNSASHYVGRFTPEYFELSDQTLTPACGSFSYLLQPFDLSTQFNALSSRDNLTENYTGSFARVSDADTALTFTAIDADVPTPLTDDTSHTSSAVWSDGEGVFSSQVTLARPAALIAPYTQTDFGVLLSDDDGVSLRAADYDLDSDDDSTDDSVFVARSEFRFGRLVLSDAHGPETSDLPVTFATQYYDGSQWLTNTDDSCSAIAQSAIAFPDGTIDVPANRAVAVGGGTSSGQFTDLSAGAVNFIAGDAGHFFTAPGAGNTGVFNVTIDDLSAYPWLQFDWDQNGSFNDTGLPAAEISFGSFRGHDRVIFWREVLQ